MTAGDGSSGGMSYFAPQLDLDERLLRGSIELADVPPAYRPVARVFRALREPAASNELAGEREAVEQIAAAVVLEQDAHPVQRPRLRSSRVAVLAATAVAVCALPLVGGMASAGALPEPAQDVASTVLGKVGISIPSGAEQQPPPDTAPPPTSEIPTTEAPPPPSSAGSAPNPGGAGTPARAPTTPAGAPAKEPTSAHEGDRRETPSHDGSGDRSKSGGDGGDAGGRTPNKGSGESDGHDR